MKLLAFDTSTDQLSIAVERDGDIWQHQGEGGALASAALIPTIERLMAEAGLVYAQLDAIAFGCGPGAFTGLRTACSVAQGLAYGAGGGVGVPVLPVDSLLAVAEDARVRHASQAGELRLLALLDARMDEMYAAPYRYAAGRWLQEEEFSLCKPEQLPPSTWQTEQGRQALAGNVFSNYGERLPVTASLPRWTALPTATAMLRLAPDLLAQGRAVRADQALPRYVRDKVAQTTQERLAAKAAK